jgi:hypothetical protein
VLADSSEEHLSFLRCGGPDGLEIPVAEPDICIDPLFA